MKKYKVSMDGTVSGTRVIDCDTGKEMSGGIESISITHKAGEPPMMRITLLSMRSTLDAEFQGDTESRRNHPTNRVAKPVDVTTTAIDPEEAAVGDE